MNYNIKPKPQVREQALKYGISFPSDEELVMLILGSGTKTCSVKNLSRLVMQALYSPGRGSVIEKLSRIKGIGESKSLAIAAALELGRRRHEIAHHVIRHPKDVVPFIKNYSMSNKEHFISITLNGAHEIIKINVVSVGTSHKTIACPREIFSEALLENASALIVCHNHPNASCEPSEDDIDTTRSLIDASKIIGIAFLDHIILDRDSYFSFLEHDLLFDTSE